MNGQQEQIREARCSERIQSSEGFTLIELMLALAILGILVSVGTVSYHHFVTKAKSVEGEIVVHEVDRLEYLYHASNNQAYTDSLANLGFAMTGTLKSYSPPELRIGYATDIISYQVRALPATVSAIEAWLLTRYRDGSVQVDRISVSDLGAFATVRYRGNATAMTSSDATNIYAGSDTSGNNEPEWSGGGSSAKCQECGRVVINSLASPPPAQK
jgi:prepilin-type N-terminal cleavage/methylation domain-containing protein